MPWNVTLGQVGDQIHVGDVEAGRTVNWADPGTREFARQIISGFQQAPTDPSQAAALQGLLATYGGGATTIKDFQQAKGIVPASGIADATTLAALIGVPRPLWGSLGATKMAGDGHLKYEDWAATAQAGAALLAPPGAQQSEASGSIGTGGPDDGSSGFGPTDGEGEVDLTGGGSISAPVNAIVAPLNLDANTGLFAALTTIGQRYETNLGSFGLVTGSPDSTGEMGKVKKGKDSVGPDGTQPVRALYIEADPTEAFGLSINVPGTDDWLSLGSFSADVIKNQPDDINLAIANYLGKYMANQNAIPITA